MVEFIFTSWALDSNTLWSIILADCDITWDAVRTKGERFGVVYCVVIDGYDGNNGEIVPGVVKLGAFILGGILGERSGVVYWVAIDGDAGNKGEIVLGVVKLLGLGAGTLTAGGVF